MINAHSMVVLKLKMAIELRSMFVIIISCIISISKILIEISNRYCRLLNHCH